MKSGDCFNARGKRWGILYIHPEGYVDAYRIRNDGLRDRRTVYPTLFKISEVEEERDGKEQSTDPHSFGGG